MEGDAPLETRGQGTTPDWMKASEADSIASEQTKTYIYIYILHSVQYILSVRMPVSCISTFNVCK